MNTATKFSRLHCIECDEITFHQLDRCVHCGTMYATPEVRRMPWNGEVIDKARRRRRKRGLASARRAR